MSDLTILGLAAILALSVCRICECIETKYIAESEKNNGDTEENNEENKI